MSRGNSLNFVKNILFCCSLILLQNTNCIAEDYIREYTTKDLPASISIATGVTYLKFEQNFPTGINKNFSFESFDLPYFKVLLTVSSSETSFFKINFLTYTPSATNSSAQVSVEQKRLNLGSFGLEYASFLFSNSRYQLLKSISIFGGIQITTFPLLTRVNTTTVNSETFNSNLIRLGIEHHFSFTEKWKILSLIDYSYPVSSKETEISSPTFLEAEINFIRTLSSNWNIGLGWNIKSQKYQVSSSDIDPVSNQSFRAQQNNLYSILFLNTAYTW